MAESIPNLWPSNISETVVSPLAIMRAQVAPLQSMTKGLLRVIVSTIGSEESDRVVHTMSLVAPGLNDVRYQILWVTHFKDHAYPVTIDADCFESKPKPGDPLPAKDVQNVLKGFSGGQNDWRPQADSEDAFIKNLGKALKSPEVRSVIDSLLVRLNEQESVDSPETTQP